MKNTNYFEGTLQLRNCNEEIYNFVEEFFIVNKISIAKKTKHKNGYDYLVSSNKQLLKLKSALAKKFSGKIILTRKLFSRDRQTGKEIFRLTLLFEQLPFYVGDVIDDRGDEVKVMKIGDKIHVKNLKTGKTYFLRS